MSSCWSQDPNERPSFQEISTVLEKLLDETIPLFNNDDDQQFYYGRSITKDIPDDYFEDKTSGGEDDYIIIPNDSISTSPPTAARTYGHSDYFTGINVSRHCSESAESGDFDDLQPTFNKDGIIAGNLNSSTPDNDYVKDFLQIVKQDM